MSSSSASSRRPIECVYCNSDNDTHGSNRSKGTSTGLEGENGSHIGKNALGRQRFRVIRSRGRTLGSGGYGYYLGPEYEPGDGSNPNKNGPEQISKASNDDQDRDNSNGSSNNRHFYLFPEEVLYLYERGLLSVLNGDNSDSSSSSSSITVHSGTPNIGEQDATNGERKACANPVASVETSMETAPSISTAASLHWLYTRCLSMSPTTPSLSSSLHSSSCTKIALAPYLVYQHLRRQTFRVVRHTVNRQRILSDMVQRLSYLQQQRQTQEQQPSSDNVSMDNVNLHQGQPTNGDSYAAAELDEQEDGPDGAEADGEDYYEDEDDDDECAEESDALDTPKRNAVNAVNQNDTGIVTTLSTRPRLHREIQRRRVWWRSDARMQMLKHELRRDAAQAPAPMAYHHSHAPSVPPCPEGQSPPNCIPAWDCYNPESTFASACPGLPDFQVVITHFNNHPRSPLMQQPSTSSTDPSVAMETLPRDDTAALLPLPMASDCDTVQYSPSPHTGLLFQDLCHLLSSSRSSMVPLKIATVSDSGAVIMFGVTDFGVPSIEKGSQVGQSMHG